MDESDRRKQTSPLNGQLGGVKTPEGKNISSQNAKKHGIFANYSTEMDDESFETVYEKYAEEFNDKIPWRALLIKQLAILEIRLKRCARFESEYLKEKLNPPVYQKVLVKRGLFGDEDDDGLKNKYEMRLKHQGTPMTLAPDVLAPLDNLYSRYESQFLKRFCQIIEILIKT